MNILLTIYCPNCGEEIVREMALINSETAEVNLAYFEQTDWECDACDEGWAIGSINIEHRESFLK